MLGRHPNEYLISSERRVIRVRRHWAFVLRVMAETVGIVIAWAVLSALVPDDLWLVEALLWYVVAAAVLRFAYKALEWWLEVIIVTDKRFMLSTGVIIRKISMMPITKVTDLSFLRTVGGQLLGYGTLRVESAGQKQDLEKIDYLPQPEAVFDAISELIFGEKGQKRSNMLPPPRKRWRART
ncbi:MAG TPA: PH domain-containing protein [Pseudonocardiaceae bacterium]|jgi:uncharacterized membrane protein YdbT with pleckstrin-like domain|nr:PH domain-containing protein [Pseudonocardiaceae bacterium]